MHDPFDPAASTPEERTREIASILAAGYLRLRAMGLREGPTPPITGHNSDTADPPNEPGNGLDSSPNQSVYGEPLNAGESGPDRGNP